MNTKKILTAEGTITLGLYDRFTEPRLNVRVTERSHSNEADILLSRQEVTELVNELNTWLEWGVRDCLAKGLETQ